MTYLDFLSVTRTNFRYSTAVRLAHGKRLSQKLSNSSNVAQKVLKGVDIRLQVFGVRVVQERHCSGQIVWAKRNARILPCGRTECYAGFKGVARLARFTLQIIENLSSKHFVNTHIVIVEFIAGS